MLLFLMLRDNLLKLLSQILLIDDVNLFRDNIKDKLLYMP